MLCIFVILAAIGLISLGVQSHSIAYVLALKKVGTSGDDNIASKSGNDKLTGAGGDDTLSGGDGNDKIAGNAGNDRIDGGQQNDKISGGSGDDILTGRGGKDFFACGTGQDTILDINSLQGDLKSDDCENALSSSSSFNIAAVDDWGCTSDTKSTLKNLGKKNPELVLALGDFSYKPDSDKCWKKIIKPIEKITHIAIGNQDVKTQKLLDKYLKHFDLNNTYYSFNYKNVHFLVLSTNTSLGIGSDQYNFALNDFQNASSNKNIQWIMVMYHYPAYTSPTLEVEEGETKPIFANTTLRDLYHPLFDTYGVDLVLEAHAHNYQRTHPLSFNLTNSSNPIIIDSNKHKYTNPGSPLFAIVGTGGVSLFEFTADPIPAVVTQQDSDFGILTIDVDEKGNTIYGTYYANSQDKLLDHFSVTKSTTSGIPALVFSSR